MSINISSCSRTIKLSISLPSAVGVANLTLPKNRNMVFHSLYVPNSRGKIHWVVLGAISVIMYVDVRYSVRFHVLHNESCVALANV